MSSLAAACADNYYFPPGWNPSKGSINKFQKSHPLGKRAKNIDEGILVIRFEMPFNVWCTSCETHIGKGVRFNAKKKKSGMYFTTPIYEFLLTCATCKNTMIIRTDPKNQAYEMVSGIRQKIETFTHDQNETERLNDVNTSSQLAEDPFFRLEHEKEDKRIAKSKASALERLIGLQESREDQYSINASLRDNFRKIKHKRRKERKEAASRGIMVPMAEVKEEDHEIVRQVKFAKKNTREKFRSIAKQQKIDIKSSSIFEHASAVVQTSTAMVPKRIRNLQKSSQSDRDRKRKAMEKGRRLKIDFRAFQVPE